VKLARDGAHVISYITEQGMDVAPSNRQSYVEAYNRQSLPIVSRWKTIMELGSQTGPSVRFHVVPQDTALDIDTDFDFRVVETLLRERAAAKAP
jgi:CMP-N-acetylneuraminic acid synthetase